MKHPFVSAFAGVCVAFVAVDCQAVDHPDSVVGLLFAEDVLSDNYREVSRRAKVLPVADRYQRLLNWVLPNERRPAYRFTGWYTPTYPAIVSPESMPQNAVGEVRVETGGLFRSPVLDLIDAAQESGRMSDLRASVSSSTSSDDDVERCRVAMNAMIELQLGNKSAASKHLDAFFQLAHDSNHRTLQHRWAEITLGAFGSRFPVAGTVVGETLEDVESKLSDGRSLELATRISSMIGRLQLRHAAGEQGLTKTSLTEKPPQLWHPVHDFTAASCAAGLPTSLWQTDGVEVTTQSGHRAELLMYQSPLFGDYNVEYEASVYPAGGMFVAGKFLAVGSTVSAGFSQTPTGLEVARLFPALSRFGQRIRYRVVVRDGVRTWFVNGREVDREELVEDHTPWLAIRSGRGKRSSVRNVSITGHPKVPAELRLLTEDSLATSWVSFFGYGGRWRHEAKSDQDRFVCPRVASVPRGSEFECLLYYRRPLLEDGEIEYEFFYEPAESLVSPAIDRQAFVLTETGIQLHTVTDGRNEYPTCDWSAADRTVKGDSKSRLPLRADEWNRMKVALVGNTIHLTLNGSHIYRHQLQVTSQRTFGLFHFVDATSARVRNMVWRGEWPKVVPPLSKQSLSLSPHEALMAAEKFRTVWKHDFPKDGLPDSRFRIQGNSDGSSVLQASMDGIGVVNASTAVRTGTRLGFVDTVDDDFDVLVRFNSFECSGSDFKQFALMLAATDQNGVETSVVRIRQATREYVTVRHAHVMPDGRRAFTAKKLTDESPAGTLRMIRRGSVVHGFVAQGDSTVFRYLGEQRFSDDAETISLKLTANSSPHSPARVFIKSILLRSKSGNPLQSSDPKVMVIAGMLRQGAPSRCTWPLAEELAAGRIKATERFDISAVDSGVQTKIPSAHSAVSGKLPFKNGIVGDFDIAAELGALHLSGKASAGISAVADGMRATVHVHSADHSLFHVRGKIDYSSGASEKCEALLQTVTGLRLVRIQNMVFFMYSGTEGVKLLGQGKFTAKDLKPGMTFLEMRSSDSSGQDTSVIWESVDIRAGEIVFGADAQPSRD